MNRKSSGAAVGILVIIFPRKFAFDCALRCSNFLYFQIVKVLKSANSLFQISFRCFCLRNKLGIFPLVVYSNVLMHFFSFPVDYGNVWARVYQVYSKGQFFNVSCFVIQFLNTCCTPITQSTYQSNYYYVFKQNTHNHRLIPILTNNMTSKSSVIRR